jgi:penicillin-insensitive murein DD-endopeptidase
MRRSVAVAAVLVAVHLTQTAEATDPASRWSLAKGPFDGPALAIGFYSAGCVQGARELPAQSESYTIMRPERRRMFGHPRLVEFVTALSQGMARLKLLPLGVGDLGQARGGPAPNGHASHQNGLDVDLWFSPGVPGGEQHSMVDPNTNSRSQHWSDRVPAMLELAANDARVDRVFVNPVIKKELCRHVPALQEPDPNAKAATAPVPVERPWLNKIRPWWGHDEHFHVRLACPDDSPGCQPQPPLPKGDGCGEIDWWLSPETAKDRQRGVETYGKRVGAKPKLPAPCGKLLP